MRSATPPPDSAPKQETPDPTSRPAPSGESAAVSRPRQSAPRAANSEATGDTNGEADGSDGAGTDGSGAPRRRRRGSRGGRNRKRPAGAGGATTGGAHSGDSAQSSGGGPASGSGTGVGNADRDDDSRRGHNERATADRGLTTEDVGAEAREEAGLTTPSAETVARPKIGDSRPAPTSASASAGSGNGGSGGSDANNGSGGGAKKRRRRGGRNRSRSGSGGGSGSRSGAGAGAGNGTSGGGGGSSRGGDRGSVVTASIPDDDGSVLEELDEETLERRRGRTRKGRPTGRYQMIVHVGAERTIQMGVLEGRSLVEHYVSRPEDDATSIDGNIYLGKVQNVLPGMEAAFVDIGTPKNGVIYQRDVQFDATDVEGEGSGGPKIEKVLKNGQAILVQVTKNPIGHKGARLTQDVSLAGRFVVMVPNQPTTYGISKRLPDDERKRLRKVLEGIRPTDAGLIVRTAAEGATADELARDLARLQDQWRQISALADRSKSGTLLYREPPLVVRVIREEFTKEYRSVVIDDEDIYAEVKAYVDAIAPELSERVERYEDEALPIFERFHIHEQLHKALDRKVWLPSGGSLIIERTEALTVVDVNTGKNVGKSNLEDTVFANNLEAADEVARQLRLRDIGGIIVIDFIDMEIRKNRDAVVKGLREALARDKTRTQVFEISELGLVEMTRKRISEGLVEAFSETCTVCGGRGFVVDEAML
ncbi:MAG: Rne/Rng family ribonuclease [Acidimicrobiia bacterium]|nr:Rne/Rng family ribonuclease [Acidimicrobiia bacterium]